MAKTIDLTSTVINITPTKAVNFGGGNKNGNGIGSDFSVTDGYFKKNGKAFTTALTSITNIDTNIKAIKVAITARNKLDITRRKEDEKYRKADLRRQREERIDKAKNLGKSALEGLGKAVGGAVGKAKGLLGALGILSAISNIAGGFLAFGVLKKLQNSNFLGNIVKGFMGAIKGIMDAVSSIPTSTLDKIGKFAGKFIKFIGNIIGWGIKNISQGLDKILDNNGNLKMSIGGIFQLFSGIAGLGLTYRYLKNPTKIVTDFTDTISGIAGLFGIRIPGLSGGKGGRGWQKLGTKQNPMHVYVTNQGGMGGGDGRGRGRGFGGGLGISPRFATPRGSGINFAKNFVSRGPNGGNVARMGSLINESTGRATRMLGGDKAVDVMKNLKANNVSKANRARVLAGELSQSQAIKIAQEGGPQGIKGALSKGGNFFRGQAQRFGNTGIGKQLGKAKNMIPSRKAIMTGAGNLMDNARSGATGLMKNISGGLDNIGSGLGNAWKGTKNLAGKGWQGAKKLGGDAWELGVKGVKFAKGKYRQMGEALQNLNPMELFRRLKESLRGTLDTAMESQPILKKLKELTKGKINPKKAKGIIKKLATKASKQAKPALASIKKARKMFPVPGLDAMIGALTAVIEIAAGGSPGNAILGALGGVLGSVAGTAAGTAALPGPGSFIGAMAGGIGGEIVGRGLARGIGNILPEKIRDLDVFGTGAPLFATAGNGYGSDVQRDGKEGSTKTTTITSDQFSINRPKTQTLLQSGNKSDIDQALYRMRVEANKGNPDGYNDFVGNPKFASDTQLILDNPTGYMIGKGGRVTLKKQRGGSIVGGSPSGDSIPALLERGEFVLNRNAASAVGHGSLNSLNNTFSRFQEGGLAGMDVSGIMSAKGVTHEAKIKALTDVVLGTSLGMSTILNEPQRVAQDVLNSVDVGADASGTQESSISASSVAHTNTNEALSLIQSMELNNIR